MRGDLALEALDVGDAGGEVMGVVVILGQAIPVVLQRIERGGGDHAGLAHRAAQHLLLAPGFLDEVLGAREEAPTGAPRPLV